MKAIYCFRRLRTVLESSGRFLVDKLGEFSSGILMDIFFESNDKINTITNQVSSNLTNLT